MNVFVVNKNVARVPNIKSKLVSRMSSWWVQLSEM
jgi:hypothetical protein